MTRSSTRKNKAKNHVKMAESSAPPQADDLVCQLYLVVDPDHTTPDRLMLALQAAPIACALLRSSSQTPTAPSRAETAAPFIRQLQDHNIAALLADAPNLVQETRADGMHLSAAAETLPRYAECRATLSDNVIIGAHAGKSRHVAMSLAEAGADYIAFGAPPTAKDQVAAHARRLEFIAWWATLFEVPCVAMDVTSPDEAHALARAGADFIALTLPQATSDADIQSLIRTTHAAITAPDITFAS